MKFLLLIAAAGVPMPPAPFGIVLRAADVRLFPRALFPTCLAVFFARTASNVAELFAVFAIPTAIVPSTFSPFDSIVGGGSLNVTSA